MKLSDKLRRYANPAQPSAMQEHFLEAAAKLDELEAENNAYEKRENAYIAQIDAWEKVTVELLKKGERMAMALSDAQCGYVCEHRMNWSDARKAGNALLEKNDGDK